MDEARVILTESEIEYIIGLISDDYLRAFGTEDSHATAVRLMLIKNTKTKLLTALNDVKLYYALMEEQ